MSSPLCDVINESLLEGVVPMQWKKSTVCPVPKESPPTIDKLRPISLTDHFAKLAELYVYRWVLADICQGIDKQQFGNRQGVSTTHYLVDLLHFLHSNADKPQTVSTMVITDFTKAFDLVNHNIAVSKLHLMGTRPALLPWICSFLHQRVQVTRYHGVLSTSLMPSGGVPQGTRLGPLIFLVLINDALATTPMARRWKYVDDLTIAESRKMGDESAIATAITDFQLWCDDTQLRLNPAKCKVMQVSFARAAITSPRIELCNNVLEEVKELKLLGVIIQANLRWNSHVNEIIKKASRKFYLIRSLKRFNAPRKDLLTVYTSYIRPTLEYCVPLWHSGITVQQSNNIEMIQKRALRIILSDQYVSYRNALQKTELATLSERRDKLSLKFAESLQRNFKDWLPEAQNQRLRRSNRLREIKCRTERFRNSALPFLVRLINRHSE
eukprot:XP_011677655.1 PREDICTED: RNA-directed DNA polymerase from mobile element jockey-like [Strongylocentrotus purpuratus]